jgi:hypothetical protein
VSAGRALPVPTRPLGGVVGAGTSSPLRGQNRRRLTNLARGDETWEAVAKTGEYVLRPTCLALASDALAIRSCRGR